MLNDLRSVLRSLLRAPGYVLGVALILALGLGVNLALGTQLQHQILRPFDGPEPDRLVEVSVRRGLAGFGSLSPYAFLTLQREAKSLAQISASSSRIVVLERGETLRRVSVSRVSAATFPMLGLPAYFRAEDDLAGQPRRAVLSFDMWVGRFGSDPSLVGRSIRLDGVDHLVTGILPKDFRSPDNTSGDNILVPLALTPTEIQEQGTSFLNVTARLAPSAPLKGAQEEVRAIYNRLETERSGAKHNSQAMMRSKLEAQNPARKAQGLLIIACGAFVLLIACANVANLALTRWLSRSRDLALRAALGADHLSVLRPLLFETFILALLGGSLALGCHGLMLRFLAGLLPWEAGRPTPASPWLFLILILLAMFLLMAPLSWVLRSLDPAKALKDVARGTGAHSHHRLRSGLVITQVATATTLLATSFLLVRSLHSLSTVPLGFEPTGVLTSSIHLPKTGNYATPDAQIAYQNTLLERARNLPGVAIAGIIDELPLRQSSWASSYTLEGEPEGGSEKDRQTLVHVAAGDYFRVLGIPLMGRNLESNETSTCVVSASFAEAAWPNQEPYGHTVKLHRDTFRVVGVAGDARHMSLRSAIQPQIYISMRSEPQATFNLVVRANGNPTALIAPLQEVMKTLDRSVPADRPYPMTELIRRQVEKDRTLGLFFTGLSVLALLLAALGLASALSLAVAQRRPELGLRMALGAQTTHVVGMILHQGLRQVFLGLVIGLPGAWGLAHLLQNQLYGVGPGDPRATVLAALVLALTGLLACLIPALRATRVNPAEALRSE